MPSRRWIVWTIVLLAGAQGCYEYVPVETPSATVGKLVELKITDPGRVGLAPRFGPGLDLVEGRLVAQRDSDLTVSVLSIRSLDGGSTRWSGESVSLNRGFIRSMSSRRLSPIRTTLLATAAATVLYLTAGRSLSGGGKDPQEAPEPPNPPISSRIPVGVRIRGIP